MEVGKIDVYCYIATKPCGCTVAICVDLAEYKDQTADSLSDWVRCGMRVERVPLEDGQYRVHRCHCSEDA